MQEVQACGNAAAVTKSTDNFEPRPDKELFGCLVPLNSGDIGLAEMSDLKCGDSDLAMINNEGGSSTGQAQA